MSVLTHLRINLNIFDKTTELGICAKTWTLCTKGKQPIPTVLSRRVVAFLLGVHSSENVGVYVYCKILPPRAFFLVLI